MLNRRLFNLALLLTLLVGFLPAPSRTEAVANNSQTLDLNFGASTIQKVKGSYYFDKSSLNVAVPISTSRTIKNYTYTINGVSKTINGPVSGNKINFTADGKETTIFGEGFSNPGFVAERTQDGKGWTIGATDPDTGRIYSIKYAPMSGSGCFTGSVSGCPGLIPVSGSDLRNNNSTVTIPNNILRFSNGDAYSYSKDVPPVDNMYLVKGSFDSTERVPWTSIVSCSVTITGATPSLGGVTVMEYGAGNCGKGKLKAHRALISTGAEGSDYENVNNGKSGLKIMRNYFMNILTSWKATTYAYQGTITINYEPPAPNKNGFTGDFDILPANTITYGDTFKFHPRDIETTGICTFQSLKFRITRGTLVFEGSSITSKTTDDVYTSAKYPYVIQSGSTHDVYMQINTSCGSDWIGPQPLEVMSPGSGSTPTPVPTSGPTSTPTPTPDNKPPVARISWLKSGTTNQVAAVAQNSIVDVKVMEKSDPDGDEVTVKDWDFDSGTDWLKSKGEAFGGGPYEGINGFAGIMATELGAHTIKMTVQDTKGATYTTSATLNVVDAKPVAVIRAPINVVEGRALPSPIDGTLSYSPLGLQITEYDWTNKADRYYTPGNEIVRLRVKDEEGRWSDIAQKTIEVLPDLPPIDTLAVPTEGTRLGTSAIQSGAYSPDYDQIVSHKIEMKYDAANDGFANDSWQIVVNGNGDAESFTFTPSRVGKYLFQETVCEDFGKCGNTNGQPESERTLNVTNLAPTADVKTESDVTDPPSATPMLMTDLFNTGRFFNLAKGTVGDKSSWKLENGVLKTKIKTPLRNVGQAHKPFTSDYQNGVPFYFQGFKDNGTLTEYGETYGFENRVATPFYSMQSNPTTNQLFIPGLSGSVMGWIEDDKYTYIMTQPDRYYYNDQTIYVYDKSFNLIWSKTIPYTPLENQRWVYGSSIDMIHFTEVYHTSEQVMRVHDNTLTVTVMDKNDPAKEFFIGYNRDTGAESFKIPISAYGRTFIGPDGYLLGTKKYDFNGNDTGITFTGLNADRAFTSFKYNYFYGNSAGNGSYSYVMFNPNMTPKASYGNNWSNGDQDHSQPYFIGTDSSGNLIGAGSGDHLNVPPYGAQTRIYKLAPNGALTYSQFPNYRFDGDDLTSVLLALDYKDHVWFSGASYDAHDVKVYDESANLLKTIPFRMPEIRPGNQGVVCRAQYGFVGADGLVTIMGMCMDTAVGPWAVYIKYMVIDPNDFSVVVEGNTPNMAMYSYPWTDPGTGFPTLIHPHDDQTFILEFRDYSRAFYILKTNGATPRPKIVDAGESTPDLITGSFVAANQTLKASLKAGAPDGKGTGFAYRIRDDRNYYSVEWEANELRVKKDGER
ncbi:hypothetical protein [Cohnella rhizosphaerae]|uniref:PKD domain-containing protein n=1 Tax=Cohnella rhizosphaerae TaxID=1457232 RepID=A0A9X4L214_9BACL|nr:hypothetical protein [Cohnella rhizosphaerae]MDG0814681.1 hypothetical protein [Cohnella rhizosphaerae]